jgi:hypothetical protein
MRIRILAVVCFLLAAGFASPGVARADSAVIGVDGCAILASIVYTEVTEARLGFAAGHGSNPLYAGRNEITLCNQMTRSVTGAYKAALRQTNIYITWGFDAGYSGDYCLSHFLSQCYPTGDPAMPPLSRDEYSFVVRSWQAVQDSVQYRVVQYPGSDVARFRDHDLRQGIRRSIRFGARENRRSLTALQ